MALLTDRDLITVRDLLSYENDLLETADRERVEIDTKIELATAEVRTETETEVDKILRSGVGGNTSVASIGNVVATPSLLRWIHSRCLALFFFECFGHQMNERFRAKFDHYRQQAEAAKQDFLQRGIGVADVPLNKPGGLTVQLASGSLPTGSYYFAATWSNTRGQQSSLGATATTVLDAPGGMILTPPAAPAAATGWNVFLGSSPEQMYRQNTTPIPPGTAWTQSVHPETAYAAGSGQMPDRYLQPQRIFQRG